MLQQYYYNTTVLGPLSQWPTGHVLAVYAKGTQMINQHLFHQAQQFQQQQLQQKRGQCQIQLKAIFPVESMTEAEPSAAWGQYCKSFYGCNLQVGQAYFTVFPCDLSMDLCYKPYSHNNLQKLNRFHRKLVYFLLSASFTVLDECSSLNKHNSLLRNLYITNQ